MKSEIKERWVEALRSGEYKQGEGRLKKGDEYCCLGVLCDIVKDELGLEWETIIIDDKKNIIVSEIDESSFVLSDKLINYCDLISKNPKIEIIIEIPVDLPVDLPEKLGIPKKIIKNVSLSELNDDARLDFKEIAYLIEKYL